VASPPPPASDPYNAISLPDEAQPQWRTYDLTSTITLNHVNGKLRLWLPLAQYKDTPWQRSLGHGWRGNFDRAGIYRDPVAEMEVFYADWQEGSTTPQLQLVSQVAKQDRHFDITRRGSAAERGEVLRRCLQASRLVPTDGLVRQTAERAIGRIKDPVAQGKAIYDWVVENTAYDPSQSGIGRGDVEAMLDSGQLSGKSADIALLFVGLCRSIGIPHGRSSGCVSTVRGCLPGSEQPATCAPDSIVAPNSTRQATAGFRSTRAMCARPSTTKT
jgi:transglutaminase-like putative cysteine protease